MIGHYHKRMDLKLVHITIVKNRLAEQFGHAIGLEEMLLEISPGSDEVG
jgi:hypothetical protein